MRVGISQITLRLPGCHSLKEKRQVIKSLMARVRNQFEVAIAEVDEQDSWHIAILGVSALVIVVSTLTACWHMCNVLLKRHDRMWSWLIRKWK